MLAAIEAIGIGLGSLTIFAGALGVGIGFGLQSLAGNLASGLTLIFSRALRKGDWVTVGDTVGVIQEVGIRATRLRTRDAVEYLVPNNNFVTGTIVSWTHTSPFVRQHVPLGVSYGSDPDRVREILLKVAAESPMVVESPPPEVWFVGFGDSSLDFELLVWANFKLHSEKQVRSELYFRIFRLSGRPESRFRSRSATSTSRKSLSEKATRRHERAIEDQRPARSLRISFRRYRKIRSSCHRTNRWPSSPTGGNGSE